jgi:hypothetical protein
MDDGGSFSVNRYFLEGGFGRMWRFDRLISLSAGYGQDDYRFSGLSLEPWNNIDNYRVGIFTRWALDDRWMVIGGPSIRSYGEAGGDLEDALTSAFFGGATYKFSDRLTLGPGVGLVEQLHDDVSFFPVVFVNWNITERLSLETGGGLAATGGPGLSLNYTFSRNWKAGLTGRYEKKRFLLNDEGLAPDGFGEDEYFPVIGNISYVLYPGGFISMIIGYNIDGKISVENSDGHLLSETEYDNSVNIGFVGSFRF